MTYEEAKNYLSKFGQEHILKCYDELSPAEQASLLAQIDLIDLSVLENLDNANNISSKRGKFEPLGAATIDDIAANSESYERQVWRRSGPERLPLFFLQADREHVSDSISRRNVQYRRFTRTVHL